MAMKNWILMRWSIHQSVGVICICLNHPQHLWVLLFNFCSVSFPLETRPLLSRYGQTGFTFHHYCYSARALQKLDQQPWVHQRHIYCTIPTCFDWGHNGFIAWGLLPNLFRSNLSDCVQGCGCCWILSAAPHPCDLLTQFVDLTWGYFVPAQKQSIIVCPYPPQHTVCGQKHIVHTFKVHTLKT